MGYLSSIASSVEITIIIVVSLILSISLTLFLIRRNGRKDFLQTLNELEEKVRKAKTEIEELFKPINRIEEDVLSQFKSGKANLINEISRLKEHKYYNDAAFRQSVIPSFENILSNTTKFKEENNKVYDAIADLKTEAKKVMTSFRLYTAQNHYFAHSEMLSSCTLKKIFLKIIPIFGTPNIFPQVLMN